MTRRFAYLDCLRVLSLCLVMYGHYVLVAGGAASIPDIIRPDAGFPLLDATKWHAYRFEVFIVENFKTQSAILGVSLFFLVTGYLMPVMCERYGRVDFLVNRFFRIFPGLAAALLIIGSWLYFSQGLIFELKRYLSSLSLAFFYLQIPNVSSVLWTLSVEVIFYGIACLIGRFTLQKLTAVQAVLMVFVWLGTAYHYPDHYYSWVTGWLSRYLLLVTIGSAIFLAEREEGVLNRVQTLFPSVVFSYFSFQVFKFGYVEASNYGSAGNHLLAVGIFLAFLLLVGRCVKKLPRFITFASDIVYPVYLLHAAIGLSVIELSRRFFVNPYVLVAIAIFVSCVVSVAVHKFVELPGISFGRKLMSKRVLLDRAVA